MFWEEKIDQFKKQFSGADFNMPYTSWAKILKKIEKHFISKNNANQHFNNWQSNIKNNNLLTTIDFADLNIYLTRLRQGFNYWVIVVLDSSPTGKQYLYDCGVEATKHLVSITGCHSFIVDKKYRWFTFFERDTINNCIRVYKSGLTKTPFDV